MPRLPLAPISTAEEVRPGRAHVLDRDDGAGLHQLEAGLQQQLLGERIADLDGRALLFGVGVEFGRGHRGAVDAVAAGLGAEIDDRPADALGLGGEDLVGLSTMPAAKALTRMLPL